MNPLSSKLKNVIFQQTQNIKFNLLINSNIQNKLSHQQKQKVSYNKKSSQTSLIQLNRFSQIKQHTMQLNIQNKLNQLKKRSYSQKKLSTHTNLYQKYQQPFNQHKRKRLISASSSSKIKTTTFNAQLLIQKQKITNKQPNKNKSLSKHILSQLNSSNQKKLYDRNNGVLNLQPSTINLQSRNNSLSKLRFVTPIKSQRMMPFSLDPSINKQSLQTKVIEFTNKNYSNQSKMPLTNKKFSQDKVTLHKNLITSLNTNLTIFVKNGVIIQDSVDFKQLLQIIEKKKQQNLLYAQNIHDHLQKIKKFVLSYNISSSIEVYKIIQLQNKRVISNWETINFFNNWKQIYQQIKISKKQLPGIKFYYPDKNKGSKLAANCIIKFFRQIKQKRQKKQMISLMYKVLTIQRYWRRALIIKKHRQQILISAENKLLQHQKLQQKFIANYQLIKTSRKTQIHIGSLAFEQFKRITLQNKTHYENMQISRIFKALQSPDTFVIYVTPFQLSQSVIKYYQRLFKIATGSDLALKQKVYFIYPQNILKISKICQLTTLNYLLCSPKALKRIKSLIKSISSIQNSYIIPSYPSIQYTNLSYELKIPIFSSSQVLSKLNSTKIGFRQIISQVIQKQKQNPPFKLLKSVSSIFSERQLINTLALLVYKNQNIKKWYFKIDDQFDSRGIAIFNVNSINFFKKLNDSQNQDVLGDVVDNQKQILRIIVDQLKEKLKQRLKILHKNIYSTYHQFITHFLTRGGVIQAAPQASVSEINQVSISFVIEPNGDFQILGSFKKLQLNSKAVCNAIQYPAKKCQKIDIQKIIRHLYRRLYLKMKFFGYFTIDLLVENKKQQKIPPYVIGLSCYLTTQSCGLFMIKHLSKVRYDKDTNFFLKIQPINLNDNNPSSLEGSKISRMQFEQDEKALENQNTQKKQLSQFQQNIQTFKPNNKNISFLYCPKIVLPNLESISDFFRKCKFENIAFDLKSKLGTIFLPLDQLQYENIGFLISQKGELQMNSEMSKVVQFLSKNYRKNNQTKSKYKNQTSKKQIDEVGMIRGVILAQMHKSQEYKKAQKNLLSQKNCQATFNNLQLF